jgi:hypothetical protein
LENFKLDQQDWIQLAYLKLVLKKFESLTKYVSIQSPQMHNSLAIYYKLHDILLDIKEKKSGFEHVTDDISNAVKEAFEKYEKYYTLMDRSDIYYISSSLDPRCKAVWIKLHLSEKDYEVVVNQVVEHLNTEYSTRENIEILDQQLSSGDESDFEVAILKNVQRKSNTTSDIELYFNTPAITYNGSTINSCNRGNRLNWILDLWNKNQKTYPCMSKVARDYLAIPASSVSVERLFNRGHDILGIRRFSMSSNTFCKLMLLKDHYKHLE